VSPNKAEKIKGLAYGFPIKEYLFATVVYVCCPVIKDPVALKVVSVARPLVIVLAVVDPYGPITKAIKGLFLSPFIIELVPSVALVAAIPDQVLPVEL
jgi:hypothetical protein